MEPDTQGDPRCRCGSGGCSLHHQVYILSRPTSVIILVMIIAALYFSFKPKPWEEESGPEAEPDPARSPAE